MAGVSIHALTVSDNPKKFAIAVTRARVDSPSFLVVFPSCSVVHSAHHPRRRKCGYISGQTAARDLKFIRIRRLRDPEARCHDLKCTRFQRIFHVVFNGHRHWCRLVSNRRRACIEPSSGQVHGESSSAVVWKTVGLGFSVMKLRNEPHYVKSQPEVGAVIVGIAFAGLPE